MPTIRYEISADEAWTHTSLPLNRYWCFFGGIFGKEADCDRLETALRAVLAIHGVKGEVKWSAVTGNNIAAYKALVDEFVKQLRKTSLVYRQIFLDRSFIRIAEVGEPARTPLDIQYLICYQFLKHHFGLCHIAGTDGQTLHHVTVRLDGHSSQAHTDKLRRFAEELPNVLGVPNLSVQVQFVNSKRFLRLQLCDLIMGAAGSYGNKMQNRREAGRRGMTDKQKWRLEMAGYIYNHLRAIDAENRGTKAFNWFESTGTDGDIKNRLLHKIRIWKFIPARFQRDEGWQNDNLDKQGMYVAPIIKPEVTVQYDNGV